MSTEQESTSCLEGDIGSLRQSLNNFILPIEKNQRARLIGYLDQELMSIGDLAREILHVPAAALQVCRIAGEMARQRDIDILTLEQACNLLGTLRLGNLLRNLQVVENSELPLAYRQLISISEHALTQAQGLFAHRMARLWHEVSLASLLFLAPCWVLVYHRPELFDYWDARHLEGRSAQPDMAPWLLDSNRVLGLAQQLAEDWWLPPWILQGYRSLGSSRRTIVKALHIARDTQHPQEQQALLDADRSLSRWLTQPANSLLMSNGLALGAHHDWDARHTQRWQQLTALYLNCDVTSMQSASHTNAVISAREQHQKHGRELWLPAEALIWPQRSRRRTLIQADPAFAATAAALPSPASASTQAPQQDPAFWRQQCMALISQPSRFSSLGEVLEATLQALNKGLGIRQTWIALYNGRHRALIIAKASGFDTDQVLTGLNLGECHGTEWGRWLLGNSSHDLSTQSLRRASSLLPDTLKQLLGDQHGRLLPLQHNGQVIGLLGMQGLTAADLARDKQRQAQLKTADCLHRALIAYRQKNG